VIQLKGKTEDLLLQLLQDAFSTGSALRKLARLEGHESKTQFLSVEVLDLQLTSKQKSVADFWVEEFLEAKPRLDSATGTRYLVAALQRAFDAAPDDNREAVFAAMLKAGAGAVSKTSLTKYASELPKEFHAAYFRGIDNVELRQAVFDIDRSVLKTELRRLVITSKDGVIISAPAETVGKSVEMTRRGKERVVRYSGIVEKERVARGGRNDRP
jgi:uncharacterized protein (DUF2267 family)